LDAVELDCPPGVIVPLGAELAGWVESVSGFELIGAFGLSRRERFHRQRATGCQRVVESGRREWALELPASAYRLGPRPE
jgi:hypothetical protein